ncbi:methyl-accepting chemotaxis protein [Gellertiella hungarica]|uniref:Methyl-accepting chemotaxis protein n=1 Tax=Gellertiella hungarica TaxID=1572859 RepID=A0A7W6J7G7_9HYPH|nr:HAMP domain-containing methyl-accepting chemotaxis protein [Gellertiella hungarica]MBB4066147.1 methyl-accepting chemotaxis protein [Gellertiella hungarica]
MLKLSISRLLVVFALVVASGLVAALAIQNYALYHLKIDSPLYNSIVRQKDFVADLLPPPLYIVEPYAAAYEAQFHPEKRDTALKRILELKKLYDERRAYWTGNLLDAEEERLLKTKLIASADHFWAVLLNEFVPVAGREYEIVDPVLEKLVSTYQQQREAVMELNGLATRNLQQSEDAASADANSLSRLAIIAGSTGVLLFLAGVAFLRARAIAPLARMTEKMRELADGKLDTDIPYGQRRDEIGEISRALLVFQKAGLAKQEMEREAEEALLARRAKRIAREEEARLRAEQTQAVVDQLGAGLERLSDCNIRMTIDEPFSPEFEAIRHSFNRSIATFQLTLERVMAGTREIREGSAELSSAAGNMAQRTEQQAAALEETAAALEQINGTIANLTASTQSTRKLVSDARDRAGASSVVVTDAVQAMQRIETSASEIGKIIGVIDEIAFQTNLLALNAGVEAARAGESGKGFAVVATEVRELAQRSAAAAKQIKALVAHSAQEVSVGVKLVDEAGRALSEIIDFVGDIDTNVDHIATGITEQADGIRQTTQAIHDLDGTTQQNAAMAEQALALSQALADQAGLLAAQVEKFKLNRRKAIREPGSPAALAGPRRAA